MICNPNKNHICYSRKQLSYSLLQTKLFQNVLASCQSDTTQKAEQKPESQYPLFIFLNVKNCIQYYILKKFPNINIFIY